MQFQVNNITLVDYGGTVAEDTSKTPRYLYSEGSLRITTSTPDGQTRTPEVYIDGDENSKAYLRVGSAVVRDGFIEASSVNNVAVTLIAVGASSAASTWAPTESDAYDAVPPGNAHSGFIVLRSEEEVRVDNEALFRVGDPYSCDTSDISKTCIRSAANLMAYPGSLLLNSTQQSLTGDSELRPLVLKGALGIEIGSLDGGRVRDGRLSRLDRLQSGVSSSSDDANAFPAGRPLIVARYASTSSVFQVCRSSFLLCRVERCWANPKLEPIKLLLEASCIDTWHETIF